MPFFFASLKVAITLAFVGSVMAETVGSNKGVGHLMLSAQAAFQVPLVFAGLLAHHTTDKSSAMVTVTFMVRFWLAATAAPVPHNMAAITAKAR